MDTDAIGRAIQEALKQFPEIGYTWRQALHRGGQETVVFADCPNHPQIERFRIEIYLEEVPQ